MDTAVPDRPGSPRIKNRNDPLPFGIFECRRSFKDHHPDKICNMPSTRRLRGLSRTFTTELRTCTAETRINTDQHGTYTDHPGLT
ncbi:hypothetical protein DPMN_082631 [Dreissena polymorpha]|uniref:Uncharacterized protein n=1 Tax=Dreissena polymorpha TaxID=45954 RepID=A0A9D3YB69_DREPO|nr:hypothetical protein DPMN_082631 [Dreissena polymorpha]